MIINNNNYKLKIIDESKEINKLSDGLNYDH